MKRFVLVLLSLFLLFSTVYLHAQWSRTYEGTASEGNSFIIPRSDGGYFLVCNMHSWDPVTIEDLFYIVILQLNSDGEILNQGAVGSTDLIRIYSVNPTSDGGFVLAGIIEMYDPVEDWWDEDIWIVKLDENGDFEWEKKYGGDEHEYASSIQQTSDSGYIVSGEISGEDPVTFEWEEKVWVLKLDADGDIEWQKKYGVSGVSEVEEENSNIQQTSDGGYVLVNSVEWEDPVTEDEEGHIEVLKLDSNGNIEWQRSYESDGSDYANLIKQTSDGGYIIVGSIGEEDPVTFERENNLWVLKLDADGDIEWQKTYGGSEDDSYNGLIRQTSDGGYLLVCYLEYEDQMNWEWSDIRALKLDSNGNIEWQRVYDKSQYDSANFLQLTSDGGYIVTGCTAGEDPVTLEWEEYIWVLKLFPDGDVDASCDFIKTSDATSSDTYTTPTDSAVTLEDTTATASDTDIPSQTSDLTSTLLCSAPQYTLTTAAGIGGTTDPAPGTYSYYSNTDVQVEAVPDNGYGFDEWTGDVPEGHESDNPITITMDSDKSITANFIRQYTLTIAAGTGGTTDPSPGSYTHDSGASASVTAIPSSGYQFSGWSGDASGTTNPITITMNSDKSITASFSATDDSDGGEDGKKGGCFIATAAYDSPLHPHLDILREFRDKYLMPNKLGRTFINFYYKHSPNVAEFISKHKALKTVVRIHLLPLIGFSYLMVHYGSIINATALVFVSIFPLFVVLFYRRRIK